MLTLMLGQFNVHSESLGGKRLGLDRMILPTLPNFTLTNVTQDLND